MKKKVIENNKKFNFISKKLGIIEAKNKEEEFKFLENLKLVRHKIKDKDILEINDWGSDKKKPIFSSYVSKKKVEREKIIFVNLVNYKLLDILRNVKNFKYMDKFNNIRQNIKKKNLNINNLFEKFNNINIKKINIIKKNNYFVYNQAFFIVLDMRSLKTKLIGFNKNKCLISVSNGLMFRKMQFNNKKYKKSDKLTYLALKNFLVRLNFLKSYKNIIIHIKGLKKSTNNVLKYLNKNIQDSVNKKIVFINDYKFSKDKFFRFKKIKAIKRKLKKKFIKSK